VSIQDTRERIFRNGQIYSRPRFGGPVNGPDTRQFTPDPNPYDIEPEPRGYGHGNVGFADTTPKPRIRQHQLDPSTPEERERFRILEGRGPFPNMEGLDPFSPNPLGNGLLDYLNQLQRDRKFKDFLLRPTDKFDIRHPVYRPGIDQFENVPLAPETGKRDFLYQYLEQNKEVMGPKTQMFDRYADPDDGTLIAADPSFAIPREVSPAEVREINRRVISDYDKKKEMLRRGFLSPLLRGV